MKDTQIERKFLLEGLPININRFKTDNITQGYILQNPEIKIKSINNETFYLIKTNNLLKKEKQISINKFNKILNAYHPEMISKDRYYIPLTARLTANIDVFKDNLEGLKIAEVQFESIEEANNFIIPDWFGKEITDNLNSKYQISKVKRK